MSRVIIKGYYGFGNFGDDILMLTTYRIVKETFPTAEILIGSESSDHQYLNKLIPEAKIVTSSQDIKVDWIIHGGGGVFFDFKKHDLIYLLINSLIKTIGYTNYKKVYALYKKLRGDNYNKFTYRAGLGIGVGTYTLSSNRFFLDILSLSSFNVLLVRDNQSELNAKEYCSSSEIYKSSDLAFIYDYPIKAKDLTTEKRQSIGFILRDWLHGNHVSVLIEVAKRMLSNGHDVKFFSLDKNSDSQYIKLVSAFAPICCWDPNEMEINHFLSEVATCKLIISSRAHGAIVPSCMGIPVLCVGIEPKLFQVAEMLKNSAGLIKEPFNIDEILVYIHQELKRLELMETETHVDVSRNRLEMLRGISLFQSSVRNHT